MRLFSQYIELLFVFLYNDETPFFKKKKNIVPQHMVLYTHKDSLLFFKLILFDKVENRPHKSNTFKTLIQKDNTSNLPMW